MKESPALLICLMTLAAVWGFILGLVVATWR